MFIGVGGGKNLTESQYCFLRDGGDSIKYNFQKTRGSGEPVSLT